mmetsp:Transcript_36162/g.84768  ORF Transcript_36162/g.84768 Transcript_36162/m.84768 type:complete len:310 (+) Transcript_36162:104-1033(+)|eukprot:CAMPEP_0178431668 /NCGR_PEP_ID=MMETSP0689_2-20121128/31976_1 /TAXON_ID=160604 /ORGANISM="Amphidinium massartii, Strain CS-259" /LENGTH=309 /DNA_ID=CAMNT_0020053607 /DNA_START=100 /DNA_END=1029 /DNA_ORIENTATION=+
MQTRKGGSMAPLVAAGGLALCFAASVSGGAAFSMSRTPMPPSNHGATGSLSQAAKPAVKSAGATGSAGFPGMLGCSAIIMVLAAARAAPGTRGRTSAKGRAVACQVTMEAKPMASPQTFSMAAPELPTVTPIVEDVPVPVTNLIDLAPSMPAVTTASAPLGDCLFAGATASEERTQSGSARRARPARRAGSARRASRSSRRGVGCRASQERRHIGAKLTSTPVLHPEEFALKFDSSTKRMKIQMGLRASTHTPCSKGREAKTPSLKKASGTGIVDFRGNHVIEQLRSSQVEISKVLTTSTKVVLPHRTH